MIARILQQKWTGLLFVVCTFLLVMPSAFADDIAGEIDSLRTQLEQLEGSIDEDAGQDEFEMATEWLDEADQLHKSGSDNGVEQRLRRVDHTLDLLRVITDTTNIEASIEHQNQAYENTRQRIEDLSGDIESLEKQKEERQEELRRVQRED